MFVNFRGKSRISLLKSQIGYLFIYKHYGIDLIKLTIFKTKTIMFPKRMSHVQHLKG